MSKGIALYKVGGFSNQQNRQYDDISFYISQFPLTACKLWPEPLDDFRISTRIQSNPSGSLQVVLSESGNSRVIVQTWGAVILHLNEFIYLLVPATTSQFTAKKNAAHVMVVQLLF